MRSQKQKDICFLGRIYTFWLPVPMPFGSGSRLTSGLSADVSKYYIIVSILSTIQTWEFPLPAWLLLSALPRLPLFFLPAWLQ